jgi:hypothetical protein
MLIDEALTTRYEKKPRVYYFVEASNGGRLIRGSWRDMYSHAVIACPKELNYENEISYGSFHSSKQLAERSKKSWENYQKKAGSNYEGMTWEVVEVKKITAKEARQLKNADRKALKAWREKQVLVNN